MQLSLKAEKERTCHCGNKYFRFSTLQNKCVKCLALHGEKIRKREALKAFKIKKKKLREKKAKSLPKLKKKLWDLVSLFVRQSAADHRGMAVCYTCGTVEEWKYMDAGHAIGGRTGAVLFDLEILRIQCKPCNGPRDGGNYQMFTAKLIEEHGHAWWYAKLEAAKQIKKWTLPELEQMIEEFTQKLSVLERSKKWNSA